MNLPPVQAAIGACVDSGNLHRECGIDPPADEQPVAETPGDPPADEQPAETPKLTAAPAFRRRGAKAS